MSSLPTVRYAAVNRCIYCDSDSQLSDEHIVPAGLDGNWVLPASSCKACAVVTSGFESKVLGDIRVVRGAIGMGTKRRKTRPKSGPVILRRNGVDEVRYVPIAKHPLLIPFPIFLAPQDYSQASATSIKSLGTSWIRYGPDPSGIRAETGADEVRVEVGFHVREFARMLAKIAYAYAVSILGPTAFEEVFVRDAIRGTIDDVGQWVFTYAREEQAHSNPNSIHRTHLEVKTLSSSVGAKRAVQVYAQLFSNSPSPGYLILVGSLRPDASIPTTSTSASEPFPIRFIG